MAAGSAAARATGEGGGEGSGEGGGRDGRSSERGEAERSLRACAQMAQHNDAWSYGCAFEPMAPTFPLEEVLDARKQPPAEPPHHVGPTGGREPSMRAALGVSRSDSLVGGLWGRRSVADRDSAMMRRARGAVRRHGSGCTIQTLVQRDFQHCAAHSARGSRRVTFSACAVYSVLRRRNMRRVHQSPTCTRVPTVATERASENPGRTADRDAPAREAEGRQVKLGISRHGDPTDSERPRLGAHGTSCE